MKKKNKRITLAAALITKWYGEKYGIRKASYKAIEKMQVDDGCGLDQRVPEEGLRDDCINIYFEDGLDRTS